MGSRSRNVRSSRSVLTTSEFEASLHYLKPCRQQHLDSGDCKPALQPVANLGSLFPQPCSWWESQQNGLWGQRPGADDWSPAGSAVGSVPRRPPAELSRLVAMAMVPWTSRWACLFFLGLTSSTHLHRKFLCSSMRHTRPDSQGALTELSCVPGPVLVIQPCWPAQTQPCQPVWPGDCSNCLLRRRGPACLSARAPGSLSWLTA